MQENGRMNWLEQIHQMKNRDIRTIEQSELQELPQDAVEHGLPQEERLKNLLDKVRNPYCYLDNGIIVKLNFAPRGSKDTAGTYWQVLSVCQLKRQRNFRQVAENTQKNFTL